MKILINKEEFIKLLGDQVEVEVIETGRKRARTPVQQYKRIFGEKGLNDYCDNCGMEISGDYSHNRSKRARKSNLCKFCGGDE